MEVKIKVGAQVDQSLRTAFRPLVQSAIDARRQILREFAQVPKEIAGAFAGLGRAQAGSFRGATEEARRAGREQLQVARDTAREQIAAAREARREEASLARIAQRQMLSEHRTFEREQRRIARETAQGIARDRVELDRIATRTSHRFTRFVTPNLPIASIAGRAARGAVDALGVDTTFAGAMRRNMLVEDAAIAATNQARLGGQEIDPAEVTKAVGASRQKYGTKVEEGSGAIAQYQALTGNLKEGLGLFDEMSRLAVGTGAKLNDLAAAGGNVAMNLGEIPNRGKSVMDVLRAWTMQGADGAVEISNLATQGNKLASMAGQFSGDRSKNMIQLGAIAQIARASGGATSAQMAGTAVTSFANTLTKGARLKEMRGVFGKDFNPAAYDPLSLIKKIVSSTGGDEEKWSKMVMDVQAKRAVRGFAREYQGAGGGAAGDAAMDALSAKFMKGGVTDEQLDKNVAQNDKRRAVQVEKFQAQLDELAEELSGKLLPVLKEAQPHFLALVKGLADIAAWAVENPWKAVVAALGASLLRAGIESTIRNSIERMIMGGGAGGGGAAGALGGLGAGGGADVSKRMKFVRGASDLSGAAALATFGVGAATDQSNKLQRATGSKTTLADLVPGFRGGKFKGTDELLQDLFDVSIGAPISAFTKSGQKNWKRKFGVVAEQTDAVVNMDDRMNSDARQRFADESAKAKGEKAPPKLSPEQVDTVVGRSGESPEALKARILEQRAGAQTDRQRDIVQEQIARNMQLLATKTFDVRVKNFDEMGDGAGSEGPSAPGNDT